MKCRLLAIVLVILVFVAVLSGCSQRNPDDSQPTTESSQSQIETCSTQPSETSESGKESSELYTRDSDDLEIMTNPVMNNESGSDASVENEVTENRDSEDPLPNAGDITEPDFPLNSGEKIELPFIPAD